MAPYLKFSTNLFLLKIKKKKMENLCGFHYSAAYSLNSSMAPPPSPPIGTPVSSEAARLVLSCSSSSDAVVLSNDVLQQHQQQEEDKEDVSKALRAKVASHPLFPQLLHAYIDCHKVYIYIFNQTL